MWIRKRIELSLGEWGRGARWWCRDVLGVGGDRGSWARRLHELFRGRIPPGMRILPALSVRTAFDLYLSARAWPAGDEVLLAGANIPDMARIVEAHGLRPRAVDFDLARGRPSARAFDEAASARTRALVVPQLFGAMHDLEDVVALARARGWELVEDNAQSFRIDRPLSPGVDLSLASFGSIKRATTLGGAIAFVRDPELHRHLRALEAALPPASRWTFGRRLLKTAGLLLLSRPRVFGVVAGVAAALGRDRDALLARAARGFPSHRFWSALRHRPTRAQLAWLVDRLERFPKLSDGRGGDDGNGAHARLHRAAGRHGTVLVAADQPAWVLPVLARDPRRLVDALAARGFDATQQATLAPLAPGDLPLLDEAFRSLVYLPYDAALPPRGISALARTLESLAEGA